MADPILHDDFTGSNGDPWDNTKWVYTDASGAGAVDIQGNRGRLLVVSSFGAFAEAASVATATNTEIVVDIEFDSVGISPMLYIGLRVNNGGGDGYYFVINGRPGGSWPARIARLDDWDETDLTTTAFDPSANTVYRVRFQVDGDTIRAKWWVPASESEPAGWNLSTTDSTITDPGHLFVMGYRQAGGPWTFFLDDLTLYDLDATGGNNYDDFGGVTFTVEASGADTRSSVDTGGIEFTIVADGNDVAAGVEPGDITLSLVASGVDSLALVDAGGDTFAIVGSGVDTVGALEAGGIEFEVTADGVDTHGHTETGAASFAVSAAGVDTHRMADAGVVEVEIEGLGTDTTTGVETGDITFSLEASGVDSIGMYDLGVTTFTIDGSGLDGFVGVDSGRVTIVFSTFGTDHASFDVTPLPRLSLVIPRVNELQWRALVDWAGRLVDALLIRLAPQPEPPPPLGFRLGEVLYYTSSGTFTPSDYPGLRAVMVECQGGGGAGGGAATTGPLETSGGNGGGAGGYARRFVLDTDLASSVAVTVGAGGSGNAGAAGSSGVASSFGSHCSANGGSGGTLAGASTVIAVGNPGNNGGTGTGDFTVAGGSGSPMWRMFSSISTGNTFCGSGSGGDSQLGAGGAGRGGSSDGHAGRAWGGGGGGATNLNNNSTARSGGDGGPGIVIVTIYY